MDAFVKSFIGGFLGSVTSTGLVIGLLIWPILTGKFRPGNHGTYTNNAQSDGRENIDTPHFPFEEYYGRIFGSLMGYALAVIIILAVTAILFFILK